MKLEKKQIFTLGALCSAVLAVIMLFLDAVKVDAGLFGSGGASGFDIIFGKDRDNVSIVGIVLLLCLVAIIVLSVLKMVGKGNKVYNLIIVVAAVLAAIIFFMFTTNLVLNMDSTAYELVKSLYSLGIGAILGGIFCLLAAGCAAAEIVTEK